MATNHSGPRVQAQLRGIEAVEAEFPLRDSDLDRALTAADRRVPMEQGAHSITGFVRTPAATARTMSLAENAHGRTFGLDIILLSHQYLSQYLLREKVGWSE